MTAALVGLVEVIDRDGRVRRALPVLAWPARIGRAIDNDVVLDDPHVAPYHARIEADADGTPALLPLPTINGVRVGRRRLRDGERVALTPAPGGESGWVIGTARLRVRLPGETLAAEKPLIDEPAHGTTVLLAFLTWAWMVAGHAIRLDPGAKFTDWMPVLLGFPAALAAWCMAWALASKIFQQRFDFWPHVAIAVRFVLATELAGFVLDWAAAISGLAILSRVSGVVQAAIVVAMVYRHARLVLPTRSRVLTAFALSAWAAGVALVAAQNLTRNDRLFGELYMSTLPPPALRWAPAATPQQFLQEAAALKDKLDGAVRSADADEKDDDDE